MKKILQFLLIIMIYISFIFVDGNHTNIIYDTNCKDLSYYKYDDSLIYKESKYNDPNFSYDDGNSSGGANYTMIELNTITEVTLNAGEIKYYTYIPDVSRFFVVETLGECDTKLKIQGTSKGMIIDDDSGMIFNAKVEFLSVENQQLYIAVKMYNSNNSGTFQLQIRKQRFSMFGYDDDSGNSTIPDLEVPFNKFNGTYETIKYENGSALDALSFDDRNLAEINSEIMFFSGHGLEDGPSKGFGVAFRTNSIRINTELNMNRTKVAIWAACFSANSSNDGGLSIAEYSVNCGAKSSVGFINAISFSSSKTFTNRFFEKLSNGSTVSESAQYAADGLLWPWDSAKNYVIFGEKDTTVFNITPSASSFSIRNDLLNVTDELDNSYECYLIGENTFRYYKKIGNYLTNSFIDLQYNKLGKIIKVNDNRKTFKKVDSIIECFANLSVPSSMEINNNIYTLESLNSRNIVYYELNSTFTPIEITIVNYKYEEQIVQIPICVNLNNGQIIDYSTINSI